MSGHVNSLPVVAFKARFSFSSRFAYGYGLVSALALFTFALTILHAGVILNLAFPALAFVIAGLLFFYDRGIYFSFAWWMWLFAPEVRRLVDFQIGFQPESPVIITPLLVSSLALITFLQRPHLLLQRSLAPFLFIVLAYAYAFIMGIFLNGLLPALYDLGNNLIPLGLGVFLLADRGSSIANRNAIMLSMMLGLLLISAYGIYQFFDIPAWDQYWITASKFASAGAGQDEQVRLFGTLNSPGPYGFVLMGSLIFALVLKGPVRLIAASLGFPAFGLCLVRSAWIGWLLVTIFLLLFVRGKVQFRILAAGSMIAILAFPLIAIAPVADAIDNRLATFGNIEQDGSYQSRASLYQNFTPTALSTPFGIGFGGNGLGTKLSDVMVYGFDSGLLQIPYQFGWVFGALIVWALGNLSLQAIAAARSTNDNVKIAAAGLFCAMVAETVAGPMFSGADGIVTWTALAIALGPSL
jgi:hypothetical protein